MLPHFLLVVLLALILRWSHRLFIRVEGLFFFFFLTFLQNEKEEKEDRIRIKSEFNEMY